MQKFYISACLGAVFLVACSIMPRSIEKTALPQMPLPTLIQRSEKFHGQTVILGGYVLEMKNLAHQTRITAVQAPLDFGQMPKNKDLSEGRLILIYDGFLDPEVYRKDRKITVAGQLTGSSATQSSDTPYPYVQLHVTHIHLWPVEKPVVRDPYWDYWGPWGWGPPLRPYPYPWGWRHPYYPYYW